MMNTGNLLQTLNNQIPDRGICNTVADIILSGLHAVDPYLCVLNAIHIKDEKLLIGGRLFQLSSFNRVFLISIGKAAVAMAGALRVKLGDRIEHGLIVSKHLEKTNQYELPSGYRILQGEHPVPSKGSLAAGKEIIHLLNETRSDDLVVFCISGGGSALVTYPYDGISLDDLQGITESLLACGATINEINTIRKHLDRVKGGGLAVAAAPAKFISLVLSDVVGDPLDVIASGPTVPDTTSYVDAVQTIRKYKLEAQTPASIMDRLQRGVAGDLPDTPKDFLPVFKDSLNVIVGSNLLAAQAAADRAREKGFNTQILTTSLQGEAVSVGQQLGGMIKRMCELGEPLKRPGCMIAGGETTVTIRGEGLGGRNLEVALGAAQEIDGLARVAFISLATDGEDGPTDAAGAVVTGETLNLAKKTGLKPEEYLQNNNTYPFFQALDGLIQMGPTGTNVNDLYFLITY